MNSRVCMSLGTHTYVSFLWREYRGVVLVDSRDG